MFLALRCPNINGGGDSPSQYYVGPTAKGRPRKRKIVQGSPEDLQVQSMRMASSALGKHKILKFVFIYFTRNI